MMTDKQQKAINSLPCVLLALARGMPEVLQRRQNSIPILAVLSKYSGPNIYIYNKKKKKAIPLQTETRLTLDTVWKAHQGGMYLKISERKHVIFKAQGHFFHNRLIDLPYISPVDTDKD